MNGSACRLVKMLSRPNIVMNQGRPAAGSERPPAIGGEKRSAARSTRLRRYVALSGSQSHSMLRRVVDPALEVAAHPGLDACRIRRLQRPLPGPHARGHDVDAGRPLAVRRELRTVKVRPSASNFAGAVAVIAVARVNGPRS